MRTFYKILLALLLFAGPAQAQWRDTTGAKIPGAIGYQASQLYWCNGVKWNAIANSVYYAGYGLRDSGSVFFVDTTVIPNINTIGNAFLKPDSNTFKNAITFSYYKAHTLQYGDTAALLDFYVRADELADSAFDLRTLINGKQPQLSGTGFVKAAGATVSYDNSTYYLASNPSAYIPLTALSAGTGISYNSSTGVITNTSLSSGGTVTTVSSSNLSPIFTSSVTTSTTTPAISYSLSNQNPNTFFAGPTSGTTTPTFRGIVAADIPPLSYLTSFSSGNLSPLFTTSVTASTTTPAITYSLSTASAYTFFGNNTSVNATPAYFAPTGTPSSSTYLTGAYTWSSLPTSVSSLVAGTNVTLNQVGNTYTVNASGSGGVSSVSSSNSSLTITPTVGAVIANINLAHVNTFTATQNVAAGSGSIPAMLVTPGGNSWSEGLRIDPSTADNYNGVYFGNITGTPDAMWTIGRNPSNLFMVANYAFSSSAVPIMTWTTTGLVTIGNGTTATLSKFGVTGNATIGTYNSTTAAPTNGLSVTGRTLLGTSTDNLTDELQVSGNINLITAGNKIKIATGTNASIGTAVLSSGTVTVSTTAVSASSKVWIQYASGVALSIGVGSLSTQFIATTLTAGTSFVIKAYTAAGITNTTDNSTVEYWIIN